MAAKKQPMGSKKTRTGAAPMPKKGAVKGAPKVGSKAAPAAMPKGSGMPGNYGSAAPRGGAGSGGGY